MVTCNWEFIDITLTMNIKHYNSIKIYGHIQFIYYQNKHKAITNLHIGFGLETFQTWHIGYR